MTAAMNRRERLMATLRGEPVDRPAISFYEIGGLPMDPTDPDPFNVYNDPSWRSLLQMAEEQTDLIRMRSAVRTHSHEAWDTSGNSSVKSVRREFMRTETTIEDGHRLIRTTISVSGRCLTSVMRRDPDVDTLWTTEHLLKSTDDLEAYLQLPDEFFAESVDVAPLFAEEEVLGDRGIVMVDTEDPLCAAATLFNTEDYTVIAFTENRLFHRLLEKLAGPIHRRTEQVAREFPGHLWRIYGPEFAAEPYLPPRLFDEYVVRYVEPMVRAIQSHGGFARIHCHGRVRNVLAMIAGMGADAIDPIEPPPQGDIQLDEVRRRYGDRMVLFGNIEVADIEQMAPGPFERLVVDAIEAGTSGNGRGFVLMPSASPFGRHVSDRTLTNYKTMLRHVCGR